MLKLLQEMREKQETLRTDLLFAEGEGCFTPDVFDTATHAQSAHILSALAFMELARHQLTLAIVEEEKK